MVKQGAIIKLNFDPQCGHEQAGFRPAVVVSNNSFNKRVNMIIVCPITNTCRSNPLHVALDNRTVTTGYVLCEQIKSVDLGARPYQYIESIPDELLDDIVEVIFAEIGIVD